MVPAHPYLPTSLELPGFHPALMSQMYILGTYGGASALVVLAVWLFSGTSTLTWLQIFDVQCGFFFVFF